MRVLPCVFPSVVPATVIVRGPKLNLEDKEAVSNSQNSEGAATSFVCFVFHDTTRFITETFSLPNTHTQLPGGSILFGSTSGHVRITSRSSFDHRQQFETPNRDQTIFRLVYPRSHRSNCSKS